MGPLPQNPEVFSNPIKFSGVVVLEDVRLSA